MYERGDGDINGVPRGAVFSGRCTARSRDASGPAPDERCRLYRGAPAGNPQAEVGGLLG